MINNGKSSSTFTAKRVVIAGFLILLIASAAGGYWYYKKQQRKPIAPEPVGTITGINYNPPTEQEQKQADENKTKAEERSNLDNQTQPTTQKRTVNVTVTSLNQNGSEIEVYAYVAGVVEEGGTCTATFKKDSQTITKTSSGIQDATTTICTPMRFPGSELSKGTWSVTLSYSSSSSQGNSKEVTLKVE